MGDGPQDGGSRHNLDRDPVSAVSREGGVAVVRLAGELDLYNADQVRAAVLGVIDDGLERLVVDLGEVEFLDSTALGVLVEARSRMPNRRALLLVAPSAEILRPLAISGLDRHLGVFDSVADALAAEL